MINFSDYPPLLKVAEAQKLLRVGRGKVYDMIRAREIPAYRLRGAIRIPRDVLLDMLEQQQDGPWEQEKAPDMANIYSVPLAKGGE